MTLDERFQRAVDTLGDKLRDQFRDDLVRELQSLSDQLQAQAEPPPPPAVDTTAIARLADALRAIDEAASLSDILDALAQSASNESARAGVFLVHDDAIHSYRLFGFPARYEDAPIVMSLDRAGVVHDAIAQRSIATSAASPFDELPPGVDAVAIPILLAGAAIGALYVEGADLPTMDVLVRFASRALESFTAMKTARAIAEAGA